MLDDKEFEFLVKDLLSAIEFKETEVTGGFGDGGVDAKGILNLHNIAKMEIFVQAKRYKKERIISAATVRQFRESIETRAQGVFVTTAKFRRGAHDIANKPCFPIIGLVNGKQLVDLLVEHWDDIPEEFQDKLALRRGLVPV